jgi:hypothetical protein
MSRNWRFERLPDQPTQMHKHLRYLECVQDRDGSWKGYIQFNRPERLTCLEKWMPAVYKPIPYIEVDEYLDNMKMCQTGFGMKYGIRKKPGSTISI